MAADFIPLKKISDERGSLVVLEEGRDIPFPVKRSYYIFGMSAGQPRGFHAHRKLEQVFVCIQGGCDLLLDDGRGKRTLRLEGADRGVYVGPMVWHEMHGFTPDCIFISYASDTYDEADYIRDYDDFMKEVSHG